LNWSNRSGSPFWPGLVEDVDYKVVLLVLVDEFETPAVFRVRPVDPVSRVNSVLLEERSYSLSVGGTTSTLWDFVFNSPLVSEHRDRLYIL
jgi:hypothetical protein